jgi:hypothetical protein
MPPKYLMYCQESLLYETFLCEHFEKHYALDMLYKLLLPKVQTKRNLNHLKPKGMWENKKLIVNRN